MPEKLKNGLEQLKNLAFSRGGECLSDEYINIKIKYKWKCKEGHTWEASGDGVKSGTWCPECSTGKSEKICSYYMEEIFGKKFLKVRPSWLLNPETGSALELDGYNEELKLAFEHNGIQHYSEDSRFWKEDFDKLKARDAFKIKRCEEKEIKLLVIPALGAKLSLKNFPFFISAELRKMGLEKFFKKNPFEIDISAAYTKPNSRFEEVMTKIKEKGGKIVKTKFESNSLLVECSEGHQWVGTIYNFNKGVWCLICSGTAKKELSFVKELAENNGVKCLSSTYESTHSKMLWECNKAHQWTSSIEGNKKRSCWCLICHNVERNVKTLEELKGIALNKNGKCLSSEYTKGTHKMKWQCVKGHEWEATANGIRRGKWCPKCLKYDMDWVYNLAKIAGITCLSTVYKDIHAKMKWECKKGHCWETSPNNIRKGTRCPFCFNRVRAENRLLNNYSV